MDFGISNISNLLGAGRGAIRAALALALGIAAPAMAQPASQSYPLTAEHWDADGLTEFGEKDGRQTLRLGPTDGTLKGGQATLKGVDFDTGVIEYDMWASGEREFAGFYFHVNDAGDGELYYIRSHMNGNPDADQYTPLVNGNWAWQIFTDEGFTSKVRFNLGKWMHVRADIYRDSMVVTVDGQPALVAPDLKTDRHGGALGITGAGGTYFANFKLTPIPGYTDPKTHPAPKPLPAGSVQSWQVSPAMPEADAMARAARGDWAGIDWVKVAVETNGIANLSKAGPDSDGKRAYIARFTVRSDKAQTVQMPFGFSDQVHLYLNGQLLYYGSDKQGSRDYRFLGIVGFWDTLYLPLKAGANQVTFVVTDGTNGGTAALAKFEAATGLTIE